MAVSDEFKKRYGEAEYEKRLAEARKKMAEKKAGRKDPHEYRLPKADKNKKVELRLKILPELRVGDPCEGGVAKVGMDNWYHSHGYHWVEGPGKVECPRLHDNQPCEMCQTGFDLLNETDDDEQKQKIKRKYLAMQFGAVNAYFLNTDKNPEEVRGKVLWVSFGKTIMDKLHECLSSDESGDADNPKAHGLFYDVSNGYTLLIVAKKKGEWNNYDETAFLPKAGPLAATKDGKVDWDRVKEIMDSRHDIPAKFAERSQEKVQAALKKLTGGASSTSGEFDDDESKPSDDGEEEAPTRKAEKAHDEPEKPKSKAESVDESEEKPAKSGKSEKPADEDDEELQNLLSKMENEE